MDCVCRKARDGEEGGESVQRAALQRHTDLPNIWCAGGRGEPGRGTLEAERKVSPAGGEKKKNAIEFGGVFSGHPHEPKRDLMVV